jgi:hypothetical protein
LAALFIPQRKGGGDMGNENLRMAKKNKNDDFYTLLPDIEVELSHYTDKFTGKAVYCSTDDPTKSNFWKYFHMNFSTLGLRRLISSHYVKGGQSYAMIYDGGRDNDIGCGEIYPLTGDGDFRSPECLALLDEADVVVTNPPFSLFREFVALLVEKGKEFLIIGNKNAITYKEFFPLLKDDKVWIGINAVKEFYRTDKTVQKFGNIGWFTNLDHAKRHMMLPLDLSFVYEGHEDMYPKYDNYDAINVDKVDQIPCDYKGVMGVPITFLDKYCPEQFEIVSFCKGEDGKDLVLTREGERVQIRQDPYSPPFATLKLEGEKYTKEYQYTSVIRGKIGKRTLYRRILIRRKDDPQT